MFFIRTEIRTPINRIGIKYAFIKMSWFIHLCGWKYIILISISIEIWAITILDVEITHLLPQKYITLILKYKILCSPRWRRVLYNCYLLYYVICSRTTVPVYSNRYIEFIIIFIVMRSYFLTEVPKKVNLDSNLTVVAWMKPL